MSKSPTNLATGVHEDSAIMVDVGIPISDVIRTEGALDDDRLAQEVMGRYRVSAQETWRDRQQLWVRNLLMLYVDQWMHWHEGAMRYLKRSPIREKQFTANVLLGRVQHMAAKLTQGRPNPTAIPENPDIASRRIAKLHERIFINDHRELRLSRVRYLATLDALIFGLGIVEVGYDEEANPEPIFETLRGEDGKEVLDAMGQPLQVLDRNGDPKVDGWNYPGRMTARNPLPFSMFFPPAVEEPALDYCPWVIRTQWVSIAEARERWDIPDDVVLDDEPPDDVDRVEPITLFLQRFGGTKGSAGEIHRGQVLAVQYFERRTDVKGFEYGKVITVINGKKVDEDRSQFEDGDYPFIIFPWVPRRGQFLPQSWVDPLCEAQKRYNSLLSHVITYISLLSNPNILVPKGSGLPQTFGFNFRTYLYNPSAGPPSFWTPPPLPAVLFQMLDRALADMDRIGQQSPFSRGEPVPGVPAARYAQLMQDADATELGPIMESHAEAWSMLGEKLAKLHAKYDPPQRTLAIVGKSKLAEFLTYSKADLSGKVRFHVESSSLMASMPSARIEQVTALLQQKTLWEMGPPERRRILEYIDLPNMDEIEDGSAGLQNWCDGIMAQLIEGEQEVTLPPWTEPDLVGALKAKLMDRLLDPDTFEFDEETKRRVVGFKQMLDQVLEAAQKQAEAETDQRAQKQFGMMAEGERFKSENRIKERAMSQLHKTAGNLIEMDAEGEKPKEMMGGGPMGGKVAKFKKPAVKKQPGA